MDHFQTQLAHLTALAKHPGWKEHAWLRAQQLEASESGLWTGIKVALTRSMLDVSGPEKATGSGRPSATKRPSPGPK